MSDGSCRHSPNNGVIFYVLHNATLATDHYIIPYRYVIGNCGLAAHRYIVSNNCAAGNTALSSHEHIFPDLDVMSDLAEIIDLRTGTDNGIAKGATINRGVGAYLDIVFDDHGTELRELVDFAALFDIPESICPDDRPGMEDDALT